MNNDVCKIAISGSLDVDVMSIMNIIMPMENPKIEIDDNGHADVDDSTTIINVKDK